MTNFEEHVNGNNPLDGEFRVIQTEFNCHDNCPSQTAYRKVAPENAFGLPEEPQVPIAQDGRVRAVLTKFFEDFGKRHISRITEA